MGREKRDTGQGIPSTQIQQIQELAETIRYGSITLVFQDGILIQIEKIRIPKSKNRLDRPEILCAAKRRMQNFGF